MRAITRRQIQKHDIKNSHAYPNQLFKSQVYTSGIIYQIPSFYNFISKSICYERPTYTLTHAFHSNLKVYHIPNYYLQVFVICLMCKCQCKLSLDPHTSPCHIYIMYQTHIVSHLSQIQQIENNQDNHNISREILFITLACQRMRQPHTNTSSMNKTCTYEIEKNKRIYQICLLTPSHLRYSISSQIINFRITFVMFSFQS